MLTMDFLEWLMYDVKWHQISIGWFKLYDYLIKHAKTICISEDAGVGCGCAACGSSVPYYTLSCQVPKVAVRCSNKLVIDSLL